MPEDLPTPAILIVDDNPANLLAVEAVLEPLGLSIVTAKSGDEALRKILEQAFVLVLMDVHMPEMDGYETVALMRQSKRSRDIPVVFLTAVYDRPEHVRRGYDLGAVDYVSKPFDTHVLRGKVRALVLLYTRGESMERERSARAERVKDLFLGAVGHDLRNPLGAILLGAQLIASDSDPERPAHAAHARKIERAALRMQGLIENILDLTRRQFTGPLQLTLAEANLSDVCQSVVDECRVTHPKRDVRLELSGDLAGLWDAVRLGRVIANLVGNALDHVPGGSVDVRASGDERGVELTVHNDGAPVPESMRARLFEPFRRGDTSANGLGLGLYIVREVAHAHGGTVDVTSTAQEGTTFRVRLPKRAAASETAVVTTGPTPAA